MADHYDDDALKPLLRLLRERHWRPCLELVWERDEVGQIFHLENLAGY